MMMIKRNIKRRADTQRRKSVRAIQILLHLQRRNKRGERVNLHQMTQVVMNPIVERRDIKRSIDQTRKRKKGRVNLLRK